MTPAVGASLTRLEAVGKATGKTLYTADIYLPGMLYAKAVRSPYAHACITSIDVSEALALPGVHAVLTAEDLPEKRTGRSKFKDMPLLARDVVRFTGEPVALVTADDLRTATAAVDLIKVEYEALPAVFDPLEAMEPDAVLLHPELGSYEGYTPTPYGSNVFYHKEWRVGDPEVGFSESDLVLETTYTTQPQSQCYMEPRVCQVAIDDSGKVTIWSSNKSPFPLRAQVAAYIDLPPSRINVISTHIGGDFGGKGWILAEPMCYYLALKTGRPVRFPTTRDEEMAYGCPRHASVITIKAGVTRDGRIRAWKARTIYNTGAYAAHNFNTGLGGAVRSVGPYSIPHVTVETLNVYTNLVHHGHVRAPGDAQACFAVESHMDVLAEAIGMDPIAFRQLNAIRGDDSAPLGKERRDYHLLEVIDLAVATHKEAGPPPAAPAGFVIGTGFASVERYLGTGKSGARVRANADGTVTVITGAVDVGTGVLTILRQIAAEALSIPVHRIEVVPQDTDTAFYDEGSGSSRHTTAGGSAVFSAIEELLRQATAQAARMLTCAPDSVHYADGHFTVKEASAGTVGVSLGDVAQQTLTQGGSPLEAVSEVNFTLPPETCFAACIADVAVDLGTGQVKPLRIVSAHDIGKVLNPLMARSQVEGGVLQAVGYATTEHLIYNENGQVVTPLLSLYGMPNATDVPQVAVAWLEGASSPGPFGAKSLGEICFTVVTPAVANAVRAAIKRPVTSLPLSPDRVMDLIQS